MIRAALVWVGILILFLLMVGLTGSDFAKEKFTGWYWIFLGLGIGLIVK